MFAITKTADLNYFIEGGQLYLVFPSGESSVHYVVSHSYCYAEWHYAECYYSECRDANPRNNCIIKLVRAKINNKLERLSMSVTQALV